MRLALLALLVPASLSAQDLGTRVASVGTGSVRMQFASDSTVCGNGRGIISTSGRANEWEADCERGPVRVAIDVTDRKVTALRSYVGGRWRGEAELDLGEVPAAQAMQFLMQVAATADSRPARDAIFPALIAEGPAPDAQLLAIAKDDSRPRDVRSQATFWLSQSASDRATAGLQELIDDPESAVREQAVFALSQRPNDESVPALIRLARTHRDPTVRRRAVFWLGQKRDPRAISYFEELLVAKQD